MIHNFTKPELDEFLLLISRGELEITELLVRKLIEDCIRYNERIGKIKYYRDTSTW